MCFLRTRLKKCLCARIYWARTPVARERPSPSRDIRLKQRRAALKRRNISSWRSRDHGEPIAQYIAVGTYLVPNNLSANRMAIGYADPNIFIPEVVESVQVDGGAYNVREGNHSVNLAATYSLRSRLDPFIALTGDYRDIDLVAGFSPSPDSWMAFSGSFGNGFLDRLEHRQQYKFNGERFFHLGQHRLTLFGIGYYGVSKVPGLVPIFPTNADDANFPNLGDTIDPRQKDQTHTALSP